MPYRHTPHHPLVVFLNVLRHQRVNASSEGTQAEHQQDDVGCAHGVSRQRLIGKYYPDPSTLESDRQVAVP